MEERAAYDALAEEERAAQLAPQIPEKATAPSTAVVASFRVPMDAFLGPGTGGHVRTRCASAPPATASRPRVSMLQYQATRNVALELEGPAAEAQRAARCAESEGGTRALAPATASVDMFLNQSAGSASDSATAAQER
jgi:hypothetical protein